MYKVAYPGSKRHGMRTNADLDPFKVRSAPGDIRLPGRRYRCSLDAWLDQVLDVCGLSIPYGAPNAKPVVAVVEECHSA